jgi:uncharacterized protein
MSKHEVLDTIIKNSPHLSWIEYNTIFLTVHGSIAYGLNTPESDVDIRGICIPPKEYLYGFNKNFDQTILEAPNPDCTIFSLKKFFSLTAANNPNTLELLFVEPEDHIYVSDIGKYLLNNRDAFLSKLIKERYIGYSKAQAHRIKNHRRWLLNPMESPPTRKEMGLREKPEIEKNQFDAIKAMIRKKIDEWIPDFEPFSDSQKIYLQGKVSDILSELKISKDDSWAAAARTIGLDDNIINIIKKEKEFENKTEDWENFLKWKKNRNPKRAALEAKFGFDLKHGTQLVRLLKLGKEALETGKLQVKRTFDREELMSIKQGAWTFDQLVNYADKIEDEVKEAYNNSKLPNQPNINLLDKLCIELVELSLSQKK